RPAKIGTRASASTFVIGACSRRAPPIIVGHWSPLPPTEIIKLFALTRMRVRARRWGSDSRPRPARLQVAVSPLPDHSAGGVSGFRDRNDEPLYTAEIPSKPAAARLTPFIVTPDTPGTSRSRCRIATAYVTDR